MLLCLLAKAINKEWWPKKVELFLHLTGPSLNKSSPVKSQQEKKQRTTKKLVMPLAVLMMLPGTSAAPIFTMVNDCGQSDTLTSSYCSRDTFRIPMLLNVIEKRVLIVPIVSPGLYFN